jgi:hypothetical protein
LRKRQQGVPEEIKELAWKAQHRLHKRYMRLAAAGKDQRKIIAAAGRELLGLSVPSGARRRRPASCAWRPDEMQELKATTFPRRKKQKNNA